MAKRIKTKFASKGRKSALRVESLEQRQLLATITGAGIEVGTDIHHQNGNVYDQVLMTGSSVTVSNDPGQITRVSFLDLQGDIVQAEFSGAGTLTVSMDPGSYHTNVAPTDYNQTLDFVGPDGTHYTGYVEGLASFTIQNSDTSTNIAIFSVGAGNAVDSALFDATHTGGDHVANVQSLVIVANPGNKNGSTFGSIYAGDAIFEGSMNTVGIAANNIQVQGTVTIGNVDASDSAVPTLSFGASSQFGTIDVTLGNLLSANGAVINDGNGVNTPYGYGINFTAGTDSAGNMFQAHILGDGVTFANTGGITHNITTLDASTDIYIDDGAGHTISQDQLDALFLDRTFTNDVTIHGVLQAGFNIDAAAFRGNVEFTGDVMGSVALQNINGTLTPSAVFAKDVTFDGNLGGNVFAETLHNVTVDGNFSGWISAFATVGGEVGAGHIGNLIVDGDFSGNVASGWDIGNVWVGGDLTNSGYSASLFTLGAGGLYLGNIGNITVVGDVNTTQTYTPLLAIYGKGTFGDVVIEGNGDLGSLDHIGSMYVNSLGAGQTGVGSITVTDDVVSDGGTGISFAGVNILNGVGSVGAISITGGNTEANGSAFTLSGALNAGSFGNISVSGFSTIALSSGITANKGAIGDLMLSTIAGTKTLGSAINVSGTISAATSIGQIGIDAGDAYSSVSLTGDIYASTSIASLNVNGGAVTLGDINIFAYTQYALFPNGSIGDVTFTASGDISSHADIYAGSVGHVTMTAGDSISLTGGAFQADTLAGVTLSADKTITAADPFDITAYTAIGDVSLTAGTSLAFAGHIYGTYWSGENGNGVHQTEGGAGTIGDVTMTASDGGLTFSGSIGISNTTNDTATIGKVSLSASGDVTVSGNIRANNTIGDIGFAAGGDASFSGTIGGTSASKAGVAVGDVSFTTTDGNITSTGWIGDAHTASLGAVALVAHGHDYYDSTSKMVKWGNGDVTVSGYIVANDSIGSVTLDAHDSAGSVNFTGHIGSPSEDGDVGGLLAIGDVSFLGNSTVASHDGKSTLDYGEVTVGGTIGDYNTASIASITAAAAQNLTVSADINAGNGNTLWSADFPTTADTTGVIGDVTFTATAGWINDTGRLHADTELGNVSLAAKGNVTATGEISAGFDYETPFFAANNKTETPDYVITTPVYGTAGNVSFASTGGNVNMSGWVGAGDLGSVTFAADAKAGTNTFSGLVWGVDSLGDVSFTAHTNTITGALYADAAGSFTFNGTTNMTVTAFGDPFNQPVSNIHVTSADVITFSDAATLTGGDVANITVGWNALDVGADYAGYGTKAGSLHGLSFDGDTTLNGTILNSTNADIDGSGDANGIALHFTNLVTDGNGTLLTHTVGDAVFDGNTTFTGGTFWIANDHTAALDTIGNLTFNGTVTGDAGVTDIQASRIGNITISGALDLDHKVLVSNFNVFVGNNTSSDIGVPGEALSSETNVLDGTAFNTAFADGANINEFTIGNITVQDTQTFGFSGTALFSGASGFNAIGGIGNVKLLGGGTVTKQDALFNSGSDSLTITAGVFGSATNAINLITNGGFDLDGFAELGVGIGYVVDPGQTARALLPTIYGVDPFIDGGSHYDGNGPVYGANNDQTSDQVLLSVVTDAVDTAINAETNATFSKQVKVSIGNIEINAGSQLNGGAFDKTNLDTVGSAGGLHVAAGVDSLEYGAGTLTNVSGSIGNIFVHNDSQVLGIYNTYFGEPVPPNSVNDTWAGDNSPGTFVAHSVGNLQTYDANMEAGDYAIIGNDINHTAWVPDGDEFVVIVV